MTVTALRTWKDSPPSELERARRGDEAAFAELVHEHEAMVFSIALHALGRREIAEDIAQEVFLQLYRSLDRIGSDEHLVNWLRRTTTHRVVDACRTRSRVALTTIDSVPEPRVEANESDPLLSEMLREGIRELSPINRMIVILRFAEQMQLGEIATSLQMPINTVKTNLRRSLARLRSLMLERKANDGHRT